MAKLLDRIRRANAGEGVRIGFGAAASKPVPPRLAVIAQVPGGGADALKALLDAGADAVVLGQAPNRADLESTLSGNDKGVAGLAIGESVPENLDELIEAGLDFLILESTKVSVSVLRQENLSLGLRLPANLDDTRLRALAGAPGAFAIAPLPGGDAPTVEDLIEVRRIGLFLNRPIFVEASAGLSTDDLAALRDSGLSALVVDGSGAAAVSDLRERLNSLPAPIKPAGERPAAVLPAGGLGGRSSD